MTREGGSAGKSNVQPPEILRCLFNELSSNGLIMKSIEPKLASLKAASVSAAATIATASDPPSSEPSDASGNTFLEFSKVLEEVAQKPISRVASAVTISDFIPSSFIRTVDYS
jgi:hypothetical protein